jgi:4-diphosphocytidyl-2-C-methyl-D-erythritol kinase
VTAPGSTRTDREVRVRAPGKVNLSLRVGAREPDGYHPLATVFQAVSLYEDVVARHADDLVLTVSGPQSERVPTDGTNLALLAARRLAAHTGVHAGAHLHLHKGVPVAGGMAGGSADAAAALIACDALWRTGVPRDELVELAAELGSDVPFPLTGHTAIGTGRGHLLTPAMARGEYHWAFAVRDEGLPTAQVFAMFDELIGGTTRLEPEADRALMQALRAGDASALGRALHNDLQHAALELAPSLAEPLAVAEDAGALGVLVSGSGPTVAALARSRQHAVVIAAALTAAGVADDVATAMGPVPGARIVPPGQPGAETLDRTV